MNISYNKLTNLVDKLKDIISEVIFNKFPKKFVLIKNNNLLIKERKDKMQVWFNLVIKKYKVNDIIFN
jgi:hypothetical protein